MSCKLLFVFGTRPEAVKLAPLIVAAQADPRFSTCVISTGQHEDMLHPVVELFGLKVDYDFKLMRPGQNLAALNSRIAGELIEPLQKEKPDWTIVQGDTTTCAAAAMSAFLLRYPVAHVEAGLRTHDLTAPWPEEFNRRVTALSAGLHFAPTAVAHKNLLAENISPMDVHMTGNTGIDALLLALNRLRTRPDLRAQVDLTLAPLNPKRKLILLTVHRREAHGEPLRGILRAILTIVSGQPDVEIAIPVHKNPQVRRAIQDILGHHARWNHDSSSQESRIHLFEPMDYLTFLSVMERSTLILTDSGGVQEEAPTLKKPVLILRETTERDEAVQAGCAQLVGFNEARIMESTLELLNDEKARQAMFAKDNPFGDGHAAKRILDIFAAHSRLMKVG